MKSGRIGWAGSYVVWETHCVRFSPPFFLQAATGGRSSCSQRSTRLRMLTVLCAASVRGGMHRQTNRSGVDGLPGTCQPNYEKAQFPIGCERALPPPFPGWLGLAAGLGGSCTSPESPAIEAQCNEAVRGAWSLAEARTEAEAVQACRAGCVRCAKCAYVSVSWTKRTCSWYSACDTSRLVGGARGATFRTYFVRLLGEGY